MSWQTFEAHAAELSAMVNVLLDRYDRRMLRRLVGIYEQGSRGGIPIGEVFNTSHGAVLVGRPDVDRRPKRH
ncbi:MAG: hypothetical protein JWQ86_4200 [Mycobacterium sp.]|nr:hypothetical protein [Mycobacterium sp.]